ncbi:MAG: hypothetical protein RXR10_02140 [Vulcanisaeta sp.]
MPGLVPFSSSGELVGRLPTVFTNPGTPSFRKKKDENKRTVRLRLLPNGAQERRLRRIADATARLWNELNYARLVQFRESGMVDFKGTEHEFYHKYKNKLGVNAGQVVRVTRRVTLRVSTRKYRSRSQGAITRLSITQKP